MNDLISLSKLFDKRIYRIPDYQRGYAWEESQLNDFWDDLANLTEDRYNEIKSLILDTFENNQSEQVEFSKNDKQIKIALMSKNDEEFKNLYENYHELFEKIDNLID